MRRQVLSALAAGVAVAAMAGSSDEKAPRPLTAADIQIRDPFVVTDAANGRYLLLSSYFVPKADGFGFLGTGARVYETRDLKSFKPAKPVLDIPKECGCQAFWAPEMHRFRGKWYVFGTINYRRGTAPGKGERGTWTFVADSMEGPFKPTGKRPITPVDWNALDGTFWEEDGKPYMVFCHEWTQIGNGEMCLVQMTDDLSAAVGEPKTLFKATDYTPTPSNDPRNKVWDNVTDGPFLHRSPTSGKLYMIWANMRRQGYAEIVCESASGKVAGPWTNFRLLFERDGGHGMLFHRLDGSLALALHQPNDSPNERARFLDVEESDGSLRIRSNADK